MVLWMAVWMAEWMAVLKAQLRDEKMAALRESTKDLLKVEK